MANDNGTKTLYVVLVFGAVGGLVSWLLQWLAGLTPFQKSPIFGIPALVLIGAVAAVFGVYLIANSDTKELPHTLAFALLCGVFWQPILDAAELYATHAVTEHQTTAQADAQTALNAALKTQDTSTIKNSLGAASDATAQVLSRSPSVQDTDLKTKLVEQSNQTVSAIAAASEKAPQEAIQNLQKIGQAAVSSGQNDVAVNVVKQLNTIQANNPGAATEARAAQMAISKSAEARVEGLSRAVQ